MAPPTAADEETPLLHDQQHKHARTPLPWRQICIILVLQLAEPLTSQVISPFAPQVCFIRRHWIGRSDLSPPANTRYWCYARRRNQGWVLRWDAGKFPTTHFGSRLTTDYMYLAFAILCDTSPHHLTLEPAIRSYRQEAGHPDRPIWAVGIYVLFWFIKNLCGTGFKVRLATITGMCLTS